MNNDFKAYKANHSSMSSNRPIANRISSNYNASTYQNNIGYKRNITGNRQVNFDLNNERKSPYQNNSYIQRRNIKNLYNKDLEQNEYEDEYTRGYYVYKNREDQKYMDENGGEENEKEIEENEPINIRQEDYNNRKDRNDLNDGYIGDGEFVRNDMTNHNNYNYSPNQNGQDIYAYYNLRNINNNININDINREYNYEPQEYPEEIEEENKDEYVFQSPEQNQNNYNRTSYNNFKNNQVYKKRRIMGNLRDSVSSEAYANKSVSRATLTDYRNSGIYIKPKTSYNNNNIIKNGISTEERGIESLKDSTKKVPLSEYEIENNYQEGESPIYNYPRNQQQEKGGKVDFNLSLGKLKNMKRNNNNDKHDINLYEENIDKIVKIQATFRYYRIKREIDYYHKVDEFIFHISKVQFNHYYDNFYFFINQLFNAYKANAIRDLNLENNQEENLEQEEENEEEENNEESADEDNEQNKSYDQLLNDYTNLKKKYNALKKSKDNNNTNNNNKNTSKLSYKKINPELASLPGETTFGSIKTDNKKFRKFKASFQNNTSTSNLKDNLTMSNYYNEDYKNNRHYYTPDHNEDEDSFNDGKDKRYSYSSIHSDENSKYFDNERPRLRFKSFNVNKVKSIGLSKNTKKNKVFEYSPFYEIDKQSRENSTKRNNDNYEIQNDKINNLSAINVNHSGIEEQDDTFERKKIEEMTYDKYIKNYSKDLRIVKNNKILLKNGKQGENVNNNNFDNELLTRRNENIIELKAQMKSDEEKMKDIFDNKNLLEKMKAKLEKEKNKYRHNNIVEEERIFIPNTPDLRFKILTRSKRSKDNYLTIKQKKEKEKEKLKDLQKTSENNFEIKNEYYYIETQDNNLPEIIEKKIKETNLKNQPIINIENKFKENKAKPSNENNFNIKGKESKKFEEIESNELTIISNEKKKKKKRNEIKKDQEIMISGEPKKWNMLKDLNPTTIEEFSLNNDDEYDEQLFKKQLYIENNEFQIIDIIRKNKKKEKEEIKINKRFDIISPIQNEEIFINKEKRPEIIKQLIKCNENNINIEKIQKPKGREIKITTKKILKQEKIISRKKFLNTKHTSENEFFINGIKSKKIDWNETNIIPSSNEEFIVKRKKNKTKEREIQATEYETKKIFENIKIENLDKININKFKKKIKDDYNLYSINNSNQIEISSENKPENKFNNLNIGKTEENKIIITNKKKDKNKIDIKPNLIEQFTFNSKNKLEKKVFLNLDIKKCEGQEIKATKKLQKNIEKISNGELMIKKQQAKKKKEIDTQIEPDLINNNLVLNNDIKYKINPQKKEDNIIVKNKSFNIRQKKSKSNSDLIIVRQKKLNLQQKSIKKFNKENIEPCYSEAITIKTREYYEDPLPKFKLSRKFSKFLISDNENLIPQNNINLINTLTKTNENQLEFLGNKNNLIQENKEKENEYIQKIPILENKNNNEDFEKTMTKQFINNMVQNKFEIEKKKNMDNTKNKLVTIVKTMKMKNALNKNIKNKKYFFDKLKNIKDAKKKIEISNSFNHNYIPNSKNKSEEYTDTFDLKSNFTLYIDNNTIEIKNKNKSRKNKLLTEIKENNINIEGEKKNIIKIVDKVDEGVQLSPKKELTITTKRIYKKEKILNKKFTHVRNILSDSFSYESEADNKKTKQYVEIATQTPRLRPKNYSPKKVTFNENKTVINNEKSFFELKNINNTYQVDHSMDISYLGKSNIMNESNGSIKIEKEEIKDNDKLFRISQFNKLFKYVFDSNKRLSFLRFLYLTKWIQISKNSNFNNSQKLIKNKQNIKNIFEKSNLLMAHKLKDFSKTYKTIKAVPLIMNLFDRRKKEAIKTMKMNTKGKKIDEKVLRKTKNAIYKLKSKLRNHCGKYIFSLYKRKNK